MVANESTSVPIGELLRRTLRERAALAATAPAPAPRFRLERRLAAAAAHGDRVLAGRWANADGTVTTEAEETDEGRLRVTIRTERDDIGCVRLRWWLVNEAGITLAGVVLTPLAGSRAGYVVVYDLGDVTSADAVDIEPATPLPDGALEPDEVAATLQLSQSGSARRAWLRYLQRPEVPSWLRLAVAARHSDGDESGT